MSVRRFVPEALRPTAKRAALAVSAATSRLRATPDFIVIGAQRCGTTTIFQTLSQHPQVRRPVAEKGTDYFTLNYTRGMSWYRSRMPLAHTGRNAKVFEACTYYMFHPLAIERLARDLPGVKVVAMLRNPVGRAYSAYKHELARGFETERDFLTALELEPRRLDGEIDKMLADPDYHSFSHRHHAYLSRGQFAEQLERVFRHIPRDRIHIIQSESFFRDPYDEVSRLQDFLGLEQWTPKRVEQLNARPSSSMPADAEHFLTEHYRAHNEALADVLGTEPAWLR